MHPAEELKQEAHRLGFELVGVCSVQPPPHIEAYKAWLDKGYHGEMDYLSRHLPMKQDPTTLLEGAKSIVAVGLNYNQPNPIEAGEPRFAKYALGRDYHKVLRGKLKRMGEWISKSYPGSQSRVCVDSAPIMERDFAQLAGLGWYGKNTMVINSQRGSWFFLGLLLTTIEFQSDTPAIGGCGSCQACIQACPTGAIIFEDEHWQVDARRCISYLTIEQRGDIAPDLAARMGNWTYGCDVCQEVCPFNQPRESQPLRAAVTSEPDFLAKRTWPNLTRLQVIQEGEWDELTQGSAVRRTGIDGIRRNAKISLENQKNG